MNSNWFLKTFFDAFVATALMTLFSYVFSAIRNKQFREPELLNDLLRRINIINNSYFKNHPAGWVIHYAVGCIFVFAYYLLFQYSSISPTWWVYTGLGFICGIVGIAGWKLTFTIHPNPPDIHFSEFYVHLLAAHIVFGLGAFLAYNVV